MPEFMIKTKCKLTLLQNYLGQIQGDWGTLNIIVIIFRLVLS